MKETYQLCKSVRKEKKSLDVYEREENLTYTGVRIKENMVPEHM